MVSKIFPWNPKILLYYYMLGKNYSQSIRFQNADHYKKQNNKNSYLTYKLSLFQHQETFDLTSIYKNFNFLCINFFIKWEMSKLMIILKIYDYWVLEIRCWFFLFMVTFFEYKNMKLFCKDVNMLNFLSLMMLKVDFEIFLR